MLSCPCRRKISRKKEALNRRVLSQALASKSLLKREALRLIGGSSYYAVMKAEEMQPLLPFGMSYYQLGGTPHYPVRADIMDIVPPKESPAPNPKLLGTTLQWKWPSEIWDSSAKLFKSGKCHLLATWGDVEDGCLGDYWLVSAIAAAARYKVGTSLFSNVKGNNPQEVTITLCKQDGPWGSFQSQFPISITTQVPVDQDNAPLYVQSDVYGEYWPCMIEKAVACVLYHHGTNGYGSIVGGYSSNGLGLMLPGYVFEVFLHTDASNNVTTTATDLFDAWYKLMKHGNTVEVTFKPTSNTALPNGQLPANQGLLAGCAYTLFAILEAPMGTAPPTTTTPRVRLALLRNPYGHTTTCSDENGGEWSGTWSNCDPDTWGANPHAMNACGWNGKLREGLFWMRIEDILDNMVPYYGLFMPTDPNLQTVDLTKSPLGGGVISLDQSFTCTPVTITVQTTDHGNELAWTIPGTPYYIAAGTYGSNAAYTTKACLESGTYTLHATNTSGTGWNGAKFAVDVSGMQQVVPAGVPGNNSFLDAKFTVP